MRYMMKKLFLIPLVLLSGCSIIDDNIAALENNQAQIQASTCAVEENTRAIEQANEKIRENRRQLDQINAVLETINKS